MIVLDASVGVKWLRAEADSEAADHLYQQYSGSLAAPDIFATEVAAALVRHANTTKSARTTMEQALAVFLQRMRDGAVELVPTRPSELEKAIQLALDLGHPLKDCIYLALAIARDCALVTADAKFVAKANPIWRKVQLLGEMTNTETFRS